MIIHTLKRIILTVFGLCAFLALFGLYLIGHWSRQYIRYDEFINPVNANRLISVCKDEGDGFWDDLKYHSYVSNNSGDLMPVSQYASALHPLEAISSTDDTSVVWSKDGTVVAYERVEHRDYPFAFFGTVYVFAYDFAVQREINPAVQFRQKSKVIADLLVKRGGRSEKVESRRVTIWLWRQSEFQELEKTSQVVKR